MPLVNHSGGRAFPKRRSYRPKTPSYANQQRNAHSRIVQQQRALDSQARQYQQQYQNQINQLINSYNPVEVPTFSPDYYQPNHTLKQIHQLMNQGPDINTKQLHQIAGRDINLLTNPQIEELRRQINAFKSLAPKKRKQVNQNYGKAQHQISQNASNLIAQTLAAAKAQGGLHSGVAAAISKQAQGNASYLSDVLNRNRKLDIKTLNGYLQSQKENAQNLLNTLKKNKKNMTKMQYNALRDQAIKQAQQAQQAQLQLLQSIAKIESGARSTAAGLAQNKAIAQNQLQQQLFGIKKDMLQLQNKNHQAQLARRQDQLGNLQDLLKTQLQADYANNLNQWMNYLTGPDVSTVGDAMQRLNANRTAIESAVGANGYLQLRNQLQDYMPGGVNPNYNNNPYYVTNGSAPVNAGNGPSNPNRTPGPFPNTYFDHQQGFHLNLNPSVQNFIANLFG